MEKDSSKQVVLTITTLKYLRGSVWKYSGGYTIRGKITNKHKLTS